MKIIAYSLLALGVFIASLNAWLPVQYWILKKRDRSRSCIPIIGGIFAAVGMLLSGEAILKNLFWLPLVLDIGCVPMVAYALFKLATRQR
jgi:hypothetical protein